MNLREISDLRLACESVEAAAHKSDWYGPWGEDLKQFVLEVRSANAAQRASMEFHRRLWNDNPVAAAGQGNISVDRAINDAAFREWFARRSLIELPIDREARATLLRELYEDTLRRLEPFTDRTAHLKVLRALAALFPRDFTTLAHRHKLRKLQSAMGLPPASGPVARHSSVLVRLEEALGPVQDDIDSLVTRMRLPWLLFAKLAEDDQDEGTETVASRPGSETLKALPAARRRRGMTGISGGMPAILNILEFAKDGVSRDDLKDHIRTQWPDLKESSIATSLNVLIAEYNLLKQQNGGYRLTPRGEAFLESGDPDDLVDWVLTRILGPDHVLMALRKGEDVPTGTLVKLLQHANPGWSSTFGPTVLLSCLRQLQLLESGNGRYRLTPSGERWRERIKWAPESLPSKAIEAEKEHEASTASPETTPTEDALPILLADLDSLELRLKDSGYIPRALIGKLHHGLWSPQRRHFAVLTGLSGSGKTQLAMRYASAAAHEAPNSHVRVIPVQPGWHDPTPLLGYVNPLKSDTYVRTDFLEFIMQAVADPQSPYTVILDEMNLSRPEQYLAPLLSAMETGASLVLHRERDVLDGIPTSIAYPPNLAIIGTVNMDETTHGLSDKVLDRAFTIEFWDIDLANYPRWDAHDLPRETARVARMVLEGLMSSLRPARLHFGWRTVEDVLTYLSWASSSEAMLEALDSVIYAKVLPKLRGEDSPRFRAALDACLNVLSNNGLHNCTRRVEELKHDLATIGTARFWR